MYLLRIVRQCSLKASFLRKVSKEPSILVMKQKLKSEINKKRAIERKKLTISKIQQGFFSVCSGNGASFAFFSLVYKRNDIIKYNVDVYKFVFFLALKFAGICVLLPGFWCLFFLCIAFARDFVVFLLVFFPPLLLYVFLFSSALCVDIHLH